jgi:phosphoribosylanthranilate isomerase
MREQQTKIKICGLRSSQDILAVNEAKPDFGGFIVEFPKSFRSITRDQLRALTKELDPEIQPVGVFVNAPIELVVELLLEGTIAIAQLHGQEDEEYIRQVQEQTHCPVIKAFSVKTAEDINRALQSPAEYILLDQGGGGTGKTFDWSLIPEISRPFFLAGGLGTQNLHQAVTRIHPWAVDLSSSLETERRKDPEKIRQAVELIRQNR